ncbi:MAG: hypothetical protein ABF289_14330 [Clostridiales bacterium]
MKKLILILVILIGINLVSCKNNTTTKDTNKEKLVNRAESRNTPANKENNPVFGKWSIKGVVAYSPVSTYGEEDIKSIEGRELTFTKENANCFGDDVGYLDIIMDNPKYETTDIDNNKFFDYYKIELKDIDITASSVKKVNISNDQVDTTELLIKDENTLILIGGGVFIELIRVN